MTTTMLVVIALTGSMAPGAKPEFRAQTDYGQALLQAANEKKPMAVLIGKGDQFAKVMADPALSAEAKKLLNQKFVCVSVDVETEAGKALAGQFQMTDGLVISSAGGTHQALRQTGSVSASDLARHAGTYASANGTPTSTVTAGATSTPAYSSTPTYSGTPVYSNPPTYSSAPSYPSSAPSYAYPSGGYSQPSAVFPSGGYRYPSSPFGASPAQCTGFR